jgi:hypothetical protein
MLSKVTHEVAAGACPAAKTSALELSSYVASLLERDDARVAAMALLYRIDRCAPEDLAAFQAFRNTAAEMSSSPSPRASQVLYDNIVVSDLWERPAPSLAELNERCQALSICDEGSLRNGQMQALWPSFPADPLAGQPVSTTSAVLILNGTLDPQTPLANATAFSTLVDSPHKTFVAMPLSAHDTVVQAEVSNVSQPPCGYDVVLSFLADPESPDTSCTASALPVSFENAELAETWFGTPDLWNNGAPDGGAMTGEASADNNDAADGTTVSENGDGGANDGTTGPDAASDPDATSLTCDGGMPIPECVEYYKELAQCFTEPDLLSLACQGSLLATPDADIASIEELCSVNLQRIETACQ